MAQYLMVIFPTLNCTVSNSCYGVICTPTNVLVDVESILPCSAPPAFRVSSYDGRNGSVSYLVTFQHSEIVEFSDPSYYFNVTIDHISDNLLGLEVS